MSKSIAGRSVCETGCGRLGFFKNGICRACRPTCPYCEKKIMGVPGQTVHMHCSRRFRVQEVDGDRTWKIYEDQLESKADGGL